MSIRSVRVYISLESLVLYLIELFDFLDFYSIYLFSYTAFSNIGIDCSLLLVLSNSTIDLGIVLFGSHRDESREMLAERFEVDMSGGRRGSLGDAHIGRGFTLMCKAAALLNSYAASLIAIFSPLTPTIFY